MNKDCVTIEELESLAAKTIDIERRPFVESHLAACASCRGAAAALFRDKSSAAESFSAPDELKLKIGSMIHNEAEEEAAGKSSRKSRPAVSWLRPVIGFASLLLVVAFGFGTYTLMRLQPAPGTDVFRDGNNGRKGIEVTSPIGKSFVEGSKIEFEWKPVENAKKYKLVVSNAGGDIIEEIEIKDTRFEKALRPTGIEKYLYWQVKTMLADGTEVESETHKIVFK